MAVPGVQMRADAVGSMPFAIYSGEDIIDESEQWENKVGFLPNPRRTLRLLEMSLALMGRAYQYRVMQGRNTVRLKYLNPETIRPKLDEDKGLIGFIRTLPGGQRFLPVEDIIYYWLEDPYKEIGPPDSCPGKAALMASGVLANVDEFMAGFFKRGAIKAMLLTVQGQPPPAERKKLEEWWGRVVSGVKNAFGAHVVNADQIKPVVVGEGLKELENNTLSSDKRNDIATALGVPVTKLFSGSAGGLGGGGIVEQDDFRFMQDTIVPECEFVASVLNEQVFESLGLRFEFRPETLDVFQQDEKERAGAFALYCQAGMPPSVVAEMLGLELPDGVSYDSLDEWELEKFERSAAVYGERMGQQQASNARDDEDSFKSHLDKWQRKAVKRGPGKAVPFESEYITPALRAAIMGALEGTKDEAGIAEVFRGALLWADYP